MLLRCFMQLRNTFSVPGLQTCQLSFTLFFNPFVSYIRQNKRLRLGVKIVAGFMHKLGMPQFTYILKL